MVASDRRGSPRRFGGPYFAVLRTTFLAAGFFATDFFAAAFFATAFFAAGFLAAAFFATGFFATAFLAAGFFAAGFLPMAFLTLAVADFTVFAALASTLFAFLVTARLAFATSRWAPLAAPLALVAIFFASAFTFLASPTTAFFAVPTAFLALALEPFIIFVAPASTLFAFFTTARFAFTISRCAPCATSFASSAIDCPTSCAFSFTDSTIEPTLDNRSLLIRRSGFLSWVARVVVASTGFGFCTSALAGVASHAHLEEYREPARQSRPLRFARDPRAACVVSRQRSPALPPHLRHGCARSASAGVTSRAASATMHRSLRMPVASPRQRDTAPAAMMTDPSSTPVVRSRLPATGTTIFSVMSALAAQHGAVNLGQGFPDYPIDPSLVDLVTAAMRAGHNQYPLMAGVPALREAIARKVERLYGRGYDPEHEVTVTTGATQAIFTTIGALTHPGDEVIVFEPAYDSYVPAVRLAGAIPVLLPLGFPGYRIDWDAVRAAVTPRTRLIVVNSPNNPGTSVLGADDLDALAALTRGTDILVLSDEVYEHMTYDGCPHRSLAGHGELAPRSVVVGSFGKTFHATGWKVGYALAPPTLTAEIRRVHQFTVFTVNAPMQHALAAFLREPAHYDDLPGFFARKRDLLRDALAGTPLELLPCSGSYFLLARYGRISDEPAAAFAQRLVREFGVATIPLSAFYQDGTDHRVIRFCFAKRDETLREAARRLQRLGRGPAPAGTG